MQRETIDASTRGAGRDRPPRGRLRRLPAPHELAIGTPVDRPASQQPSSTAAGTATYTVKLPANGGRKMRVVVHDPGGVLAGARVPTATESADVANTPRSDNADVAQGRTGKMLVASWVGTSCDRKVDVTVVGTQVLIAPAARAACDSQALSRAVTLRFKAPVKAGSMHATFIQAPTH